MSTSDTPAGHGSPGPSLRYYPVTAGGEVIGYVWAAEDESEWEFTRRLKAKHDTLRAAVQWYHRIEQGGNYGFTPLQAIRHWVGRPEDPIAGGIPADAEEQWAPDVATLERIANPTYTREPAPEPASTPDIKPGDPRFRSAGWADYDRTGYGFLTGGPVRYVPVTLGGEILGYLWASETEFTADFLPRLAAGPAGENAADIWLSRLHEAAEEGLSPVRAFRRWVGVPEHPRAGGIPADATEPEAPSPEAPNALAPTDGEER